MDMEYTIDFNDLEPSYADLPMEIIVQIFRYLNFCDIEAASQTCHRWLEASEYFEFQSRTVLKFSKICISDKLLPGKMFLKSIRPFANMHLDETVFGTLDTFFIHMGANIKSITFDSVDLTDKQFCAILQAMPDLNELKLLNCSSLFMAGQFLESSADRESIAEVLAGVRRLSLAGNQYLSDAILLRVASLMLHLEQLDLSECHISYHSAIQRRFYPEEMAYIPSESILTFNFVVNVMQQHVDSLRELNLSQTLIGGPALLGLAAMKGLQLERVQLANCRQLNTLGLNTFVESQRSLQFLDLTDCPGVTNSCIAVIADNLHALETLKIEACRKLTNQCTPLIAKMISLKILNISHCCGISTDGIVNGIAASPNDRLTELYMSHLDLYEEAIVQCAQNLTQLRVLDIGFCVNGVTDNAVQMVIKNLTWLRNLNLENCVLITDGAITGIDVRSQLGSKPESGTGSTNSINYYNHASPFNSDPSCNLKISLRTRAEEDIVRDAQRKKAMLAIYELNLVDDSLQEGVSIAQLKGLRSLNLQGCNKISDVSLKYGLKLLELRSILLSNCQQISVTGIESLVKNCPSIEELDLSDCYNINDKAIEVITIGLKRLKSLNIGGCTQLTDHSLDSIVVNCKNLQTLSVYRCRRMCSDIDLRLSNLPSLRTINMDRTGNIDNADLFRLKKRLDY